MKWPDNLEEIECVGLSRYHLLEIIKAWDGPLVEMDVGGFRHSVTEISWTFVFYGAHYRIDCKESSEMQSDGRFWWITRPYRLVMIKPSPRLVPELAYQSAWGSF